MHLISGNLQDYAWGIVDGLSAWRQDPAPDIATGKPEAELWFGAHGNGPSPLADGPVGESAAEITLADKIDGTQVPILVKLLAASKPLSLQIHPRAELAERLLARQENDPEAPQLLSDPYAKTEMLIALTDFSALLGLRDPALSAQLIDGLGVEGTTAADQLRADEISAAIRTLIAAGPDAITQAETELVPRMTKAGIDEPAIAAMQTVIDNYPGDSGILVAALLNHQQLTPGEALYAQAGIVHAYVSGIGVEVMVSSDNVFRLGLTPKTVAVDEALASLDVDLEPITLEPIAGNEQTYAPDGSPFIVRSIERGETTAKSGEYRLILATEGPATVTAGNESVTAIQGQAIVLLADEPDALVETEAQAFIAQSTSS